MAIVRYYRRNLRREVIVTHLNRRYAAILLSTALLSSGCGRGSPETKTGAQIPSDDERAVNLFIWADYIAPSVVASFEKATGIKVHLTLFETNETLEARLLTGNSGFDVVVPTAPFFERQIQSGVYATLDRHQLPNIANLDPAIMSRVALNDPGNEHGIVYAWGTYGIGYNVPLLQKTLPHAPVDSWRLIFDPSVAAKVAGCGIVMLDAPAGIVRLVLKYLGRDPNTPTAQDLAAAETTLLRIRPYIRNIDSSIGTEALANGDVCVILDYSGTVYQARNRSGEARNGREINYVLPKEGTLLWFDMLAIPRDAPHSANAHRLMNYLMDPAMAALNTELTGSANANAAAVALASPKVAADPIIYPSPQDRERLFVQTRDSAEQARAITRLWQRFKTGQ